MDSFLCIIPARGGSKGLPKKNVRSLMGKPLIAWTIDAALKSKYICKIVVSTDDLEIEKVSREYGANVIHRPAELATDTSTTIDAIIHAVEYLKKTEEFIPDYIVLLQCTSPLRNESHIDEAIEKILNSENEAESLISVTKEEHPLWWLRSINNDGFIERYFEFDSLKYSRRQDFIDLYMPNGAIYIAKREILLDTKSFQTSKTIPYIMDCWSSVDIDNEFQFELANVILKKRN